jgi:hypothetical protein
MSKVKTTIKKRYRIDSGNTMPIHGKVNYALICENGDGEIYGMDDGRNVKVVSGVSVEVVGTELQANADAKQPHIPAKWICAKKGDVVIEAPQGTLYLSGRNVVISASGPETEDQSNGNIDILATNDINISSYDTIKISGTNVTMNASLAMDIAGQTFLNIAGSMSTGGSTLDLSKGILGATGTLLKSLTGIG